MIARADAARSIRRFRDAAALYQEALRLQPENGPIHVQCGHMFKEAGEFASAETHYVEASRLMPDDADLAVQLGHFHKVSGRIKQAVSAYERAAALQPDWGEPANELAHLREIGWRGGAQQVAAAQPEAAQTGAPSRPALEPGGWFASPRILSELDRLVPEIVPRRPHETRPRLDGIHMRKLGRRDRSHWGLTQVLSGIEAVRGFCVSAVPITELQILLNGQVIHRGPVRGGYPLPFEEDDARRRYVFNVWLDFSPYAWGRHEIELRFSDLMQQIQSHREWIVVAAPLAEADHPASNAVISLPDDDPRSVEDQVNARPSVIRPAVRDLLPPLRNVLVLRTDQLGDVVTSIPALRRLRELLPDARLVGLLTAANAELAATLGVFDEIIVVDFPDDRVERRRIMPLAKQEELRRRLEPYRFDLALDLAEANTSRPLLLLSGAPILYGFHGAEWPWLTASIEADTRDPKNERETMPQSTRVLSMVERLGAMRRSRAEVMRRPDLPRARLAAFGLSETDRYAVLHAGARIESARWTRYGELAALILQRTELKIVLMADDASFRATLPPELLGDGRVQLMDRRLQFDDFDALISFCSAFVGNDSGPKHLASLRGVNTVSVQSARVNWNEWGQEMAGAIISRKVPCAGCQLVYDNEECGRDYVCLARITPEEVFGEMMRRL